MLAEERRIIRILAKNDRKAFLRACVDGRAAFTVARLIAAERTRLARESCEQRAREIGAKLRGVRLYSELRELCQTPASGIPPAEFERHLSVLQTSQPPLTPLPESGDHARQADTLPDLPKHHRERLIIPPPLPAPEGG